MPPPLGPRAITPLEARTAGIPTIEPYALPVEEDLPRGQVAWAIDPARAVLLVHDMQRYFLRPFLDPLRGELVANVAELRDRCRALGMPVVYTAQPGGMTPGQRGLLADVWGPGMTRDEADRCIVDELAPAPGEPVYTKWRYSAFARSRLLDDMVAGGRDQLVVCGVFAHVGVLVTAIDAFSNDIQPFVAADAVADFSAAYHWWALEYAAHRCAVVRTVLGLLA